LLDSSKPAGGFDMDWKLHLISSLFIYLIIIIIFPLPPYYSIQALIILTFSSLLPDLDHPKSMIRIVIFSLIFYLLMLFVILQETLNHWIKILTIVILLILVYYTYKYLPLRHRGKRSLHLWRYFLLSIAVSLVFFTIANINISLSLFILIGYGSHLLADKIKKF
jgi:hypothetical protein